MAHFANIQNGVVTEVLVVPDENENDASEYLSSLGLDGYWVQTSYNTFGGSHPNNRPLRKNYAGVGYIYDAEQDAFYEPQPHPSWSLNKTTFLWEPPYPAPNEFCYWDENSRQWIDSRIPL